MEAKLSEIQTRVHMLEEQVGNPQDLWRALAERVQHENLKNFADVETDWLAVLWCLDQYRVKDLPPRDMGNSSDADADRLSGAYRMKGGWFAELVSLLLVNQTSTPLAPRSRIQGFSQVHQIDIAWPARQKAPLVCAETKVMGAPGFGKRRARGSTSDWSNRRKELKFQATDLKLYRRDRETHIDHWDNWRKVAPPAVYFLWCARMAEPKDKLPHMIDELRALVDTYLDGAGVFAYRPNQAGTAYEALEIPWQHRTVGLSDVLHRIADQINSLSAAGEDDEPVEEPPSRAVDVSLLEPDEDDDE
jgi:hypothetical protein